MGFGPSAFSYWEGKRFRNIAHLHRYVKKLRAFESPIDFEEKLDPEAALRESFVLQLRLLEGVSEVPKTLLSPVQSLIDDNLLSFQEGKLKMTSKGILFYDTIASELIID